MLITDYFVDPVLRAPMIGSMLMCLSAALVGVIVFLKRQSLIGEALSHAAYPGVVLGVIVIGLLFGDSTTSEYGGIVMLTGAFLTAMLGVKLIGALEKTGVNADAALCFTLSYFFGIGITLASHIQFSFSNLFRQVQVYFYGQAATMTDVHIALYSALVLFVMVCLYFLRKEFKTWIFDPVFTKVLGVNVSLLETVFLLLVGLSIVIGIRSVGVVLMSAMLIAPAAAARQCTSHLKSLFALAGLFGVLSAGLGTYLANEISLKMGQKVGLPTGPMIVVVASLFCIGALLFAPERGLVFRFLRILKFRSNCLKENLLKNLWRQGKAASFASLKEHLFVSSWHLQWALCRLIREGWVQREGDNYRLTEDGVYRAKKIVRLHRLWEVYLADYVGIGPLRVHSSAEEMEHILTPQLEEELTLILKNPKEDPHHQPIPLREER